MKKIKKSLLIVLCVSILCSILCFSAFATESYNLRYSKSADGKSYICTGIDNRNATSVEIPSVHNGLKVSRIGNQAFFYCNKLINITIPDSVVYIGESAFGYCCKLKNINLSSNIKSINNFTFVNCDALEKITIPSSVKSIGRGAFTGCDKLSEVKMFDNSITSIGSSAFSRCKKLSKISIPKGVTKIGNEAFENCKNLSEVTIPDSVTSIGRYAFTFCHKLENIKLSNNLKSIGIASFGYCTSLKNITIPDTVTSIGAKAFRKCLGLTKVTIPDSVTSIGRYAFANCANLKEIILPKEVTLPNRTSYYIGDHAFESCYVLTKIEIPIGVTAIGGNAFYNCIDLEELTIPNSVTKIAKNDFSRCPKLTNIRYTGTQDEWSSIALNKSTKAEIKRKNITYLCNVPTITEVTGNSTKWDNNITLTVKDIYNPEIKLNSKPYSFSTEKGVYNWQTENFKTFDKNQTIYIYMRDSAGNIALRDTQVINKLDKTVPTFKDISKNDKDLSNGNVTLTVNEAKDNQSGLSDKPYSFSTKKGIYNWQAENTATFSESGIIYVYVRDKAGNITYCGCQTIEGKVNPEILQSSKDISQETSPKTKEDITIENSNTIKPIAKKPTKVVPNEIKQNIDDYVTSKSSNIDKSTTIEPMAVKSKSLNNKSKELNQNKNNIYKKVLLIFLILALLFILILIIKRRKDNYE